MKPPKSKESEIQDVAAEDFINSYEVINHLDMWMRGFYTDAELMERLWGEKKYAETHAEQKVLGPEDPDDPEARRGTWDESESA